MTEPARARLALTCVATGLACAAAYAAVRTYIFLRVGPMQPILVVRTSSIAYYQALAVAAVLGLGWGVFVFGELGDDARRARAEVLLERVALPIVLVCALACWLFP
jgi:hypothetical protein